MVEKTSVSRAIFNVLNYTFLILFSIICILPIWHVLMSSVSDPRELMANTGLILKPLGAVTHKGYQIVLRNSHILNGYRNTLIYVTVTTLLCVVMTSMAGYVLSRPRLKLKGILTIFIFFTMIFNGGLIPSYMVNIKLGINNTVWAVLIPGVVNAFYIIIMKSAFEQLPESYEEAARIDGAGPITIMLRILLPMVKATVAVIVMYSVIMQWNSWFQASIYLQKSRNLWPLQLIMREILVQNDATKVMTGSDALGKADLTRNLVKYCVTIVGTVPLLCIYPFVQKYFVKGVTLGGVKG